MTPKNFGAFYQLVLQDGELQEKLRLMTERELFIKQVVALGVEYGYCFTVEDVARVMQANRRAWLERWIR